MGTRFLLYSHDALGLGHIRRNLAVAGALMERAPESAVLVATGAPDVERLGLPERVGILRLPDMRKVANGWYESRRLPVPPDDILALRAALLEAAVRSYRPDVFLADKHPLGICGELRMALETLHLQGGRAALGLRDVLDDPDTVRREWLVGDFCAQAEALYDRILIYGQAEVFDPVREYEFPGPLRERSHFCGYVINRQPPAARSGDHPPHFITNPPRQPVALATVGGGEDGTGLIELFLQAAQGADWYPVVVSGPLAVPEERARLRALAHEAGSEFFTFIPGLSRWFTGIDVLICMGGYNTLLEAAAAGVPTVCVPRTQPRREQFIRARAFAECGLLEVVEPSQADPATLRLAVSRALARGQQQPLPLKLDGDREAAAQLLALAAGAAAPALTGGSAA